MLLVVGSFGFQMSFALAQTNEVDPQVAAQLKEQIMTLQSTVTSLEAQVAAKNAAMTVTVTTEPTLSEANAMALKESLTALSALVTQMQARIGSDLSASDRAVLATGLGSLAQYLQTMKNGLGSSAPITVTPNIAVTPAPSAIAQAPAVTPVRAVTPIATTPTVSAPAAADTKTEGTAAMADTAAADTETSAETASVTEGFGRQSWGVVIILLVVAGLVYWFMKDSDETPIPANKALTQVK